ncbi:MAG: hypothetical protein QM486_05045 [Flavobacteriaceae bacterium]
MNLKLLKFKIVLLFVLFAFSSELSAQVKEPIDIVLMKAAPNLAWIQRSESSLNVYKGDKFNYSLVENNNKLNNWLNNYPQEFVAYKKAMDEFFRTKTIGDFTSTDQDFYYDLKAQYEILKKLKSW